MLIKIYFRSKINEILKTIKLEPSKLLCSWGAFPPPEKTNYIEICFQSEFSECIHCTNLKEVFEKCKVSFLKS